MCIIERDRNRDLCQCDFNVLKTPEVVNALRNINLECRCIGSTNNNKNNNNNIFIYMILSQCLNK